MVMRAARALPAVRPAGTLDENAHARHGMSTIVDPALPSTHYGARYTAAPTTGFRLQYSTVLPFHVRSGSSPRGRSGGLSTPPRHSQRAGAARSASGSAAPSANTLAEAAQFLPRHSFDL